MATPRDGIGRSFLLGAGFFGAYLLLDWVSFIHPMQEYSITPWNPQPALAIALLMKRGQRTLPLVFLAIASGTWILREGHGGVIPALMVSSALTLGYAAIASALCARGGIQLSLPRASDVLRLVAIVGVGRS